MRLYLVQHGDALPEQVDPERPLSAEGRRDVEAVARLLASAGTRAVRVAHSGKLRAQQTAEVLAAAWHLPQSGDRDGSQPQRSGRGRGAKRRGGRPIRYWSAICRSGEGSWHALSPAMNGGRLPPSSRDRWSVWNKPRRAAGPSRGW